MSHKRSNNIIFGTFAILVICFMESETFLCSFEDRYRENNLFCVQYRYVNQDNTIDPLPLDLISSISTSTTSISASGTTSSISTTTIM